jgi:hypothetical protein
MRAQLPYMPLGDRTLVPTSVTPPAAAAVQYTESAAAPRSSRPAEAERIQD